VTIIKSRSAKITLPDQKILRPNLEADIMSEERYPGWYLFIKEKHGNFIKALEQLGETVRQEGPLDDKTAHLVQLAAAAASRSEGSVHSHTRRALKAGATPEEIYHAVILLTSTIGFPHTSAALSWVYDVLGEAGE
jgi:AhpD family alkylhydroperoxidase